MAKKHEPGVVTDVRVREKDAVECRTRRTRGRAREVSELASKIRRRVDHPTLAGARIDDAEACHHARLRGVVPARVIKATSLRCAAILGDAQDNDCWRVD